jgi:serine/threonine-protein kinase HipA
VFSIAIGNADMHLKNWSVIYPDGRTPKLAPAYDYVSTIAYIPDDKLSLTIARTKEWRQISEARLERFARRAAVPRGIVIEAAREMVDRVRTELPHLNDAELIPKRFVDTIEAHIAQIPLFSRRTIATGFQTANEPLAAPSVEIS